MAKKPPVLGATVEATITDMTAPNGERVVRGKVIELLSTQFVVQEPPREGATNDTEGYRFVFNYDLWKEVSDGSND